MKTQTITFDRFIRIVAGILLAVLAYLLLRRLSSVLIPFFIAWLVAYMLYPAVIFVQNRCKVKSRVLSIVIVLVVLIALITTALMLIVPPVVEEVARLKDIVVSYVKTDNGVTEFTAQVEDLIKRNINLKEVTSMLSISDITTIVERRVPQLLSVVYSSVNALFGFIASLISIIYLFFILMDYENMSKGFIRMVPASKRDFVSAVLKDVEVGMNGYFRGQTLIAFIVGILFSIGFLIIDLPLAIPLGLFIGFLNLVPYLQTLGFVPTIIMALLKAHDSGQNFWVILLMALAVFAIVQAIQDWYLTPKIMGDITGLNAAVILLSLSVWGSLLGLIGLIIALPLTTLIVAYYKRYVLEEGSVDTYCSDENAAEQSALEE
ncbi:MAG: AI-2E family transporter [Bacteroidaceae bacterium]|nr:AI-2E family transporter [Bacteroidaceae bacterium]